MAYTFGATRNLAADRLQAENAELRARLNAERDRAARLASALASMKSKHKKVIDRAEYWGETFSDPRFLALVDLHREKARNRYRDTPEIAQARLIEAAREAAGYNPRARKDNA